MLGRTVQLNALSEGGKRLPALLLIGAVMLVLGGAPVHAQEGESTAAASSFGEEFFSVFKKPKGYSERWAPDILQWKMGLIGRSYESERESARLSAVTADLQSSFFFQEYIRLNADLGVALGTGRSQALYQDFLPSNNFRLHRAEVMLNTPEGELIFRAGVLGSLYEVPQIRSGVAFPGIGQEINMGADPVKVKLAAQQGMPTSETKFTEATEIEPTPFYNTELLEIKVKAAPELLLTASAAHYRFKDLPRIVAYRSFLSGNLQVGGGGAESSFFTTGFDGYIGTGQVQWKLGPTEWDVGQQWLYNTKAPEAQNMGQIFWGKAKWKGARYEWEPGFVYFVTESDVTPAIYASSVYGRNNRQGMRLEFNVKFVREGFKLSTWYTKADVILPSTTQDDQQVFNIGFETDFQRIL